MQSDYAWPTLSFVVLAVLSVAADWWRHRRREVDRQAGRVSIIPWALVSLLSLIAAVMAAAMWLHDQ